MKKLYFLLVTVFSVLPVCAFEYTFNAGWNLFSPIVSSPVAVGTYFSQLGLNEQTDLSKIWYFSASEGWKKYVPGEDNTAVGSFATFQANSGYWVLMNSSKTVTLPDSFSSYSINLAGSGWNLVGLNSSQSVPLDSNNFLSESNFSSGTVNDIRKIWGFGSGWSGFTPGESGNTLASLDPGRAYWFLVLTDLEINSQNINLSDLFPPTCPGCPSIGN